MSVAVRKGVPSPLELQYEKLKKQSDLDNDLSQANTSPKERQSGGIKDRVTLSSMKPGTDNPGQLKPSQPVTPDEMQALRAQFSIYA